jgi:hypothetical protein
MRSYGMLAAVSAALALGLAFLGVGRGADAKGPREEVDRLAGLAAKSPADLQKEADAYAKTVDSFADVKELFKKRTKDGKGGYGVGPKPTGAADDGIEARIQNYARKSPTADKLKEESADLAQMVNRTRAVAAITLAKAPAKKVGNKDPKDWKEYAQEMVKQSEALGQAIAAADPKAVKEAASKLNTACTDCHGKFRD